MTDRGTATPETKARCPRCGYDVSVAIGQWPDDCCPLDGLCTECGLEFAWGEVLNPSRRAPAWLIEHKNSVFGTARATVGTACVVGVAPWHAMRRTPLGLGRRLARPAIVVITLVALWYLLGVGSALLAHALPNPAPPNAGLFWGYTPPPRPAAIESALIWPRADITLLGFQRTWRYHEPTATFLSFALPMHLLCTVLAFATLRVTLRRINVQRDHFARLLLMTFVPLVACACLVLVTRSTMAALEHADVVPEWSGLAETFVEWETHGIATYAVVLYLVWCTLFWWSACRWYLRLPAPAFHAGTIVLVGTLSSGALLFWGSRPFNEWVIQFMM